MHDDLRESFEVWLESGEFVDVEVGGISVKNVMEVNRSHFLGAIGGLNDLLVMDLTAKQRNAVKVTLTTPNIVA